MLPGPKTTDAVMIAGPIDRQKLNERFDAVFAAMPNSEMITVWADKDKQANILRS